MGNPKIKAQVSVELTLSLICLAILLFATAKVFVWLGRTILYRQVSYDNTRTPAGSAIAPEDPSDPHAVFKYRNSDAEAKQMINFYTPDTLKIVSQ